MGTTILTQYNENKGNLNNMVTNRKGRRAKVRLHAERILLEKGGILSGRDLSFLICKEMSNSHLNQYQIGLFLKAHPRIGKARINNGIVYSITNGNIQ
tara:strand:+ start:2905 stop:3198 length:294 start_codon:yes stop_codon:yes gene_type:complete